jgi:endonuclease I
VGRRAALTRSPPHRLKPSLRPIGKLSVLKAWVTADPPDTFEQRRNEVIYTTYQHNRNPFIDHPEWINSIWQ